MSLHKIDGIIPLVAASLVTGLLIAFPGVESAPTENNTLLMPETSDVSSEVDRPTAEPPERNTTKPAGPARSKSKPVNHKKLGMKSTTV